MKKRIKELILGSFPNTSHLDMKELIESAKKLNDNPIPLSIVDKLAIRTTWMYGMSLKTCYYPDSSKLKITIKDGEYYNIHRNDTIKQSVKVKLKEGGNNIEVFMVNGVVKVLSKEPRRHSSIIIPLYNISVCKSHTGAICVNKIIDNRGKSY